MITDSGAELLLVAVYRQAQEDLEVLFGRVVRFQKACAKGQLARQLVAEDRPLFCEDEQSVLEWYRGMTRLSPALREMVMVIDRYYRHCRLCRLAGGDEGR